MRWLWPSPWSQLLLQPYNPRHLVSSILSLDALSPQCPLTLLCPDAEPEPEPVHVDTSSLHGAPPGSRQVTLRQLRDNKWVVDPSHTKYDPSKPGGWKNIKVMASVCPHQQET